MKKSTSAWLVGVPLLVAVLVFGGLAVVAVHFTRSVASSADLRVPHEPVPLSSVTNTAVQADLEPVRRAFFQRNLPDAYLEQGRREPAWDERAVAFLDLFVEAWSKDGDLPPSARETGEALFDARCEVLLYVLTSTYFESDPPFDDKRQFGYSRDKRSDFPLAHQPHEVPAGLSPGGQLSSAEQSAAG